MLMHPFPFSAVYSLCSWAMNINEAMIIWIFEQIAKDLRAVLELPQ